MRTVSYQASISKRFISSTRLSFGSTLKLFCSWAANVHAVRLFPVATGIINVNDGLNLTRFMVNTTNATVFRRRVSTTIGSWDFVVSSFVMENKSYETGVERERYLKWPVIWGMLNSFRLSRINTFCGLCSLIFSYRLCFKVKRFFPVRRWSEARSPALVYLCWLCSILYMGEHLWVFSG